MQKAVFKKGSKFYIGTILTILEGFLSGVSFCSVYYVLGWIHDGTWSIEKSLKLTAFLVVIFLIRYIVYSRGYLDNQIAGAEVSKHIRISLGDKLKQIPLYRFTQGQVGQYVNTMNADVADYEKIITHNIGSIAKNGTLCIMLILVMFTMYKPAGIIMLMTGCLLIPNLWLSFWVVKKFGQSKNHICAETISSIVEYITGIQTLRIYGACGEKNETVRDALYTYSKLCYQYEKYGIPVGFGFNLLNLISIPVIICASLNPYIQGRLDVLEFIMICMLPILFVKLTTAISVDLFSCKNLLVAKNNIKAVFAEKSEVGRDNFEDNDKHDISFEHVSFTYGQDHVILDDVSFTIPDHKLTAIVGDSGSGKSTILNLIAKYYDINSGNILIGGENIKEYTTESILTQMSIVDQDVCLFHDSIYDNVRYAKMDATENSIRKACREANCETFIRAYEKGYHTKVGENGNRLSGGERQRLSIARAILKDSPILLLDEVTASLDIENEYAVKQAISNLLKQRKTIVMVAHTLGLVKHADQILVLSGGKIVESGTHEELISQKGKYHTMWKTEQMTN